MTYATPIQADTLRYKMRATLAAVVESMTDDDEALDRREPEALDRQDGFTVSMPAGLSYYHSTGRGTPLIDSLIKRCMDAQAAEWARQYPQRAPLPDCAINDGEFTEEAQKWEDAALDDETIWARVEILRDGDDIKFASCFTDEVNAPHGVEYRETMGEADFLALDAEELESLVARLAEAPYLSLVSVQNSSGMWHAWLGTRDGSTALRSTGGHKTEADARRAVENGFRYASAGDVQ